LNFIEAAMPSIERFALLLALAFFFGLAYEELNARGGPWRPGGIRTFPLLALTGALLYLLDPKNAAPFAVGLLVLGACLTIYYSRHLEDKDAEGRPNVTLALPFCNLLAYVLGPVSLVAPLWVPVGTTVAAVLLLTEREKLHRFAWGLAPEEVVTAGKFLFLTGIVLPLLPDTRVIPLTHLTPRQVWLAMIAICAISYASYLLQRYIVPSGASLLTAALGGLYSSTATTIVLARASRSGTGARQQAQIGIVLAVAVMYLRLLLIILFFSRTLAATVAWPLLGLSALAFAMAAGLYLFKRPLRVQDAAASRPSNPLELIAAATFAVLFVVVSIASSWAADRFGSTGVFALAGIVGVSDINPFVLTLAQHGAGGISEAVAAGAAIVATVSNNLFQALYSVAYSGGRVGILPAATLITLSVAGVAFAVLLGH